VAFRLRGAPPSPLRYDAIAPKPEAKAEKRRSRLGEASGAARVGAPAVRRLCEKRRLVVGDEVTSLDFPRKVTIYRAQ